MCRPQGVGPKGLSTSGGPYRGWGESGWAPRERREILGQNGWAPGWFELVGWCRVPWVCIERVCSTGKGHKRVGCSISGPQAGEGGPLERRGLRGCPPLPGVGGGGGGWQVVGPTRMGPKDGLSRWGGPPVGRPQVVGVSQGVDPRVEGPGWWPSEVGLSRLGPEGWVPGRGRNGEGHQRMDSQGWSPRVGPHGVGPRWVRLRGVGPWVGGTGVGLMLVSPRWVGSTEPSGVG